MLTHDPYTYKYASEVQKKSIHFSYQYKAEFDILHRCNKNKLEKKKKQVIKLHTTIDVLYFIIQILFSICLQDKEPYRTI